MATIMGVCSFNLVNCTAICEVNRAVIRTAISVMLSRSLLARVLS